MIWSSLEIEITILSTWIYLVSDNLSSIMEPYVDEYFPTQLESR